MLFRSSVGSTTTTTRDELRPELWLELSNLKGGHTVELLFPATHASALSLLCRCSFSLLSLYYALFYLPDATAITLTYSKLPFSYSCVLMVVEMI
jgi:hypothetical protein